MGTALCDRLGQIRNGCPDVAECLALPALDVVAPSVGALVDAGNSTWRTQPIAGNDEGLQARIDAEKWSDAWWNPGLIVRDTVMGGMVGVVICFALDPALRPAFYVRGTSDRFFSFDLALIMRASVVVVSLSDVRGSTRREGHDRPVTLQRHRQRTWDLAWKRTGDRSVAVASFFFSNGGRDPDGNRIRRKDSVLSTELGKPGSSMIVHQKRDSLVQGNLSLKLEPVKLESAGFNDHWTEVSDDPRNALDLMDRSTMDFLLACSGRICLEFDGGVLSCHLVGAQGLANRETLVGFLESFSKAVADDLPKPIEIMPGCLGSSPTLSP